MEACFGVPAAGDWGAAEYGDQNEDGVYGDQVGHEEVADGSEFRVLRETKVETEHGELRAEARQTPEHDNSVNKLAGMSVGGTTEQQ